MASELRVSIICAIQNRLTAIRQLEIFIVGRFFALACGVFLFFNLAEATPLNGAEEGALTPAVEPRPLVPPSAVVGTMAPPEPIYALYRMGWAGITAAEMRVVLRVESGITVRGTGGSRGLARSLYKIDFDYVSELSRNGLSLQSMRLTESYKDIRVENTAVPEPGGIRVRRWGIPSTKPEKERLYPVKDARDLFGALLLFRSLELNPGDTAHAVVCHGDRLYSAMVVVGSPKKRKFAVGEKEAIPLELKLNKVDRKGRLEPHKKMRKAVGWLSNDRHRDLLLVESEVFFGSVFAELREITRAKPR